MKKGIFLFSLLVVTINLVLAQPKIAVLDAVIDKKMDQSISVAVTEKVIERLVVSGRFTVLDRTNVAQVLKEREFQVSGMVSDAEITEAGRYLGADFVVAINVQQIADTYFITAKMIAVKTGVIANQTSAEGDGKLSVLIGLAERVGNVMAGGTVLAPAAADTNKQATKPVASDEPKKKSETNKDSRIGIRFYGSAGVGAQNLSFYNSYYAYQFDKTYSGSGAELYLLANLWNGFCVTSNFCYIDAIDDDGAAMSSFDIGAGYALPMGIIMPWVAAKIGYSYIDWPSDYTADGIDFGFDVGTDLRLGSFLIGLRYQYTNVTFVKSGYYDITNDQQAFWLMIGYRF